MIKKIGSEYFVMNHTGEKKLSKGYPSKAEAEKRLGQIEYFKNNDVMARFDAGELRDAGGELVTSRRQAEAMTNVNQS